MVENVNAVLVLDERGWVERAVVGPFPKNDLVYILNDTRQAPLFSRPDRVAATISVNDNRSMAEILRDFASQCRGKLNYVEPPPNPLWGCSLVPPQVYHRIEIPVSQRENTQRVFGEYFRAH